MGNAYTLHKATLKANSDSTYGYYRRAKTHIRQWKSNTLRK